MRGLRQSLIEHERIHWLEKRSRRTDAKHVCFKVLSDVDCALSMLCTDVPHQCSFILRSSFHYKLDLSGRP
ncbi:hypothetical protein VTL71DRAFT_1869 [Oculimacula yallundae]|uniref:Uncharacterized protein n=1 Tax=Oculimacula yallundae TaxID=86028 RepID=A0ABR4CE16_9HELO